jgi:predicted enzyme related to lactoylglutathione lyase
LGGAVLGLEVTHRSHPYIDLLASTDDAPVLNFQQVADPKTAKNRLHLDVRVENLGIATERVQAIGGRFIKECFEVPFKWRVMSEPEDNEFCIVTG